MNIALTTNQAADILMQDDIAAWTCAGAKAMIEYLEDLEEVMGEPIQMGSVDIRCEYSEHETLIGWAESYWGGAAPSWDILDIDVLDEMIREYLQDNTTLIEFDGGIIVQDF